MSFNCFMHERNIYKDRPDFGKIALDYPEFRKYAIPDKKGKFRIDFNDLNALRMLTKILLKKDFDIDIEIPDGYLIPTVPQRLNYILWIEDLLTNLPKKNETVSGIDIGTGPCAILSVLGSKKNGWHFLSTETADEAVKWANKNIENNSLESFIKVVKVSKDTVLQDAVVENVESFDFCVCNPPFFENKDDIRKKTPRVKEKLELFAKKDEIFSDGGEVSFVKNLIKDSLMLKDRISLYSSMFGKKKSCIEILKELQSVEGVTYTKTEFCQGNTIRWGIAWTFLKDVNFEKIERPKPKKPKKAKPPLVYPIIKKLKDGNILTLQQILENIKSTLGELQIESKFIKSANNYAEIEILSYKNSWSHQRRKRREQLKGIAHEEEKTKSDEREVFSCASVIKSDLNVVSPENQSPDSSKNIPHSSASCLDLEKDQTTQNEAESSFLVQTNKEQENIQKNEFKDEHSDTVSLNEQAADSSESATASVSQKRKRDDDEPSLNSSKTLSDQDGKNVFQKNPDKTSPEPKKFKILEETTLSKERKRKIQLDYLPNKKVCLTYSQTYREEEPLNLDTEQTTHLDQGIEDIPLLYSIIKLRASKENILLEMNCPPEYNRETMHQVFQLFKNKLSQY